MKSCVERCCNSNIVQNKFFSHNAKTIKKWLWEIVFISKLFKIGTNLPFVKRVNSCLQQ